MRLILLLWLSDKSIICRVDETVVRLWIIIIAWFCCFIVLEVLVWCHRLIRLEWLYFLAGPWMAGSQHLVLSLFQVLW